MKTTLKYLDMLLKREPILIFLLFSIISFPVVSQSSPFSIQGGFNLSNASGDYFSKSKWGYHIGIAGRLKLSYYCSIQPGLLYSTQGFELESRTRTRYNFNYINMPILFKYQYKKFFFSIGPQPGVLISATSLNLASQKKNDITGSLQAFDLAAVSGLGFMATKNFGIEGRVCIALVDASDVDGTSFYNEVLQLSFFYVFLK